METSELEMTPPDSPKATKEEKKAPAPEDDAARRPLPEGAAARPVVIFYDRDTGRTTRRPRKATAFHAQNGEPKSRRTSRAPGPGSAGRG